MSAAVVLVLTGTDVGVVAALRHMQHQSWIGWELAVWGLGSAVGGARLRRAAPMVCRSRCCWPCWPAARCRSSWPATPWSWPCCCSSPALFCAPTITAAVDALSHAVPERVRGEALGWHGSAMTMGGAIGAPLAGLAIDRSGWHGGFVLPSLIGLGAAGLGLLALRGVSTAPAADDAGVALRYGTADLQAAAATATGQP